MANYIIIIIYCIYFNNQIIFAADVAFTVATCFYIISFIDVQLLISYKTNDYNYVVNTDHLYRYRHTIG